MTGALRQINDYLHSSEPRDPVQEGNHSQEASSNHPVLHIEHYLWPESCLTQQWSTLLLYWPWCHLRCSPSSQAFTVQWLSDSHIWKYYQICPASYGACISLGTSTRLELGWAWGRLHTETQRPYPEWKYNPSLLSQPHPPLSASLVRAWFLSNNKCVWVCTMWLFELWECSYIADWLLKVCHKWCHI